MQAAVDAGDLAAIRAAWAAMNTIAVPAVDGAVSPESVSGRRVLVLKGPYAGRVGVAIANCEDSRVTLRLEAPIFINAPAVECTHVLALKPSVQKGDNVVVINEDHKFGAKVGVANDVGDWGDGPAIHVVFSDGESGGLITHLENVAAF